MNPCLLHQDVSCDDKRWKLCTDYWLKCERRQQKFLSFSIQQSNLMFKSAVLTPISNSAPCPLPIFPLHIFPVSLACYSSFRCLGASARNYKQPNADRIRLQFSKKYRWEVTTTMGTSHLETTVLLLPSHACTVVQCCVV